MLVFSCISVWRPMCYSDTIQLMSKT
uniref:Uncharacterized protein n=1 Tax=Anguilla anguilla TaxID=7936 RepID=A0A0E9QZW8_ANGAN